MLVSRSKRDETKLFIRWLTHRILPEITNGCGDKDAYNDHIVAITHNNTFSGVSNIVTQNLITKMEVLTQQVIHLNNCFTRWELSLNDIEKHHKERRYINESNKLLMQSIDTGNELTLLQELARNHIAFLQESNRILMYAFCADTSVTSIATTSTTTTLTTAPIYTQTS